MKSKVTERRSRPLKPTDVLVLLRDLLDHCVDKDDCMVSLQVGGVGDLEKTKSGEFRILIVDSSLVFQFSLTDAEIMQDPLLLADDIIGLWEKCKPPEERLWHEYEERLNGQG